MSTPSDRNGDVPGHGYYPDPSIPGYIRYWSGTAWVPGTSRPAPAEGEPLPAPPPGPAVAPPPAVVPPVAPTPRPAGPRRATGPSAEETGPVFLDEEPPARDTWAPGNGRADVYGGDRAVPHARDPRLPDPAVQGGGREGTMDL
ncbi:DUF2510 domain-containing protein, partial [Streptomyces sp. I05A-00742]|uniref:DUF2510 domain-containing protein n=1 Tax=Streptomyces sp. I05A-00742 TaxID=2732853 RepID=UPI00289D0AEE